MRKLRIGAAGVRRPDARAPGGPDQAVRALRRRRRSTCPATARGCGWWSTARASGTSWSTAARARSSRPRRSCAPTRGCAPTARTWSRIARDLRGGMNAFRRGRLQIRDNLHLGVGFLAATSGSTDPARLEMGRVRTPLGDIAVARAGDPDAQPVVMLHGLGGTKGSFLPTVAALADSYRTLAIDLPGFGDSVKPVGAAYDPRFFAKAVCHFMDARRDRERAPDRQLDGRPRRARGRLPPPRPRRADRRPRRLAGVAPRPPLGAAGQGAAARARAAPARAAAGGRGVRAPLRAGRPRRLVGGRASTSSCARTCSRAAAPRSTPRCATSTSTSPRARRASGRACARWSATRCSCGGGTTGSCRSRSRGTCARRCRRRSIVELECGHVPQLEAPKETHAAVRRFLAAKAGRRARRPRRTSTAAGEGVRVPAGRCAGV